MMALQPSASISPSIKAQGGREFEQRAGRSEYMRSVALLPTKERAASQWIAPIQKFALFSNIFPRDCEEIVGAARNRGLSRGHTIYLEGDPVQQVVLLKSGSAKIVQFGQNGSEVILRLCGPGELVGTLGLSTRGRHSATARALRLCDALVWEIGTFESLLRRFPALRFNTALILGSQLQDMEDRFIEICTEHVAVRLSRQILRLMDQVGHEENGAVEISLSREELAQLIGTTMFTVSRLLSDWDKRGIVKAYREGVSVQDLKALHDMSQSFS
jgi:CRP-like cAMP-binding protein